MKKIIVAFLILLTIFTISCNENTNSFNNEQLNENSLLRRGHGLNDLKNEFRTLLTSSSYLDLKKASQDYINYLPSELNFDSYEDFNTWINSPESISHFENEDHARILYNEVNNKASLFLRTYSDFFDDLSMLTPNEQDELFLILNEEDIIHEMTSGNLTTLSGPCENGCINDGVDCYRACVRRYYELMQAAQMCPDPILGTLIASYASINNSIQQRKCVKIMNACIEDCE